MKDFVSVVGPRIPLPEGLAQKIWGGCLIMGFETMVEERDKKLTRDTLIGLKRNRVYRLDRRDS